VPICSAPRVEPSGRLRGRHRPMTRAIALAGAAPHAHEVGVGQGVVEALALDETPAADRLGRRAGLARSGNHESSGYSRHSPSACHTGRSSHKNSTAREGSPTSRVVATAHSHGSVFNECSLSADGVEPGVQSIPSA
jgi:hypothetical protein